MRARDGRRSMKSSSWPNASEDFSSCRSSMIRTMGSSSNPSADRRRATTAFPSNSGVAEAVKLSPPSTACNASVTPRQKFCGLVSPRTTETQAVRGIRSLSFAHDRRRIVFPLPAGAETSVTPPFTARSESARQRSVRGTMSFGLGARVSPPWGVGLRFATISPTSIRCARDLNPVRATLARVQRPRKREA
jgi:hypothetical protein